MRKILFILIAVTAAYIFHIAGFPTFAIAAWGGDILVTKDAALTDQKNPSMAAAPNGGLYIALEDDQYGGTILVFKSDDGGETWYWFFNVFLTPSLNLSIRPFSTTSGPSVEDID